MPRSVWYGVPPRPDPHLLRRRGPARDRRQLGYLPLRPRQHLRQHRGVTSAQRVLGDTMLAAALLGRLLHSFSLWIAIIGDGPFHFSGSIRCRRSFTAMVRA